MKKQSSFRFCLLSRSLALLLGFLNSAHAVTVTEDFEDDPTHQYPWTTGQSAAGSIGWSAVETSPSGAISQTSQPGAVPGESFKGSQALVVSVPASPAGCVVEVKRTSPLASSGIGFAGLAVRCPQVAGGGASSAETQYSIVIEGIRLALLPVSSGYAQWSYWNAGWQAVGLPVPVSLDAFALASEWTRINIRRDYATPPVSISTADIWLNGKPVAVDVPCASSLRGFSVRSTTTAATFIDTLSFSDDQTLFVDFDRDGMPDSWEAAFGSSPTVSDRAGDPDSDGVTNIREYLYGSKANSPDSDGDGISDFLEINNKMNPADGRDADGDFDFDGVSNKEEILAGTNPRLGSSHGLGIIYFNVSNILPSQNGSWENPYANFITAINSVPNGGKLVVIGSGTPINVSEFTDNATARSLTITGVSGATFSGTTKFLFIGGSRTITFENLNFNNCTGDRILSFSGCPAVLKKCRFTSNTCTSATDIASVLSFTANPGATVIPADVLDCYFNNNTGKEGTAIFGSGVRVNFQRNRFIKQIASTKGGALSLASCGGSGSLISNCLFAENQSTAGIGGAIALSGNSVPLFSYCTVAYNKCSTGAALSSTALNGTTAIPTLVSSSIFWGNGYTIGTTINNLSGSSALSYCTTQGTSYNTAGATTNNTTNPAFLRDYHAQMRTNPGDGYGLSNNSPMIDRGAGPPPALDMDGQTRKRVLASYITSFVSVGDRGAFEFNDDDGDNLPGGWESLYGFDPANPADRDLDFDQDGYTNYEEYAAGTDPRSILSLPGSVIYVAPGANGTGSFASPLSSIKDALLVVANGGRIALRDGVFGGLDNLDLVPTKAVTIVGINGSGRVAVDGGLSKRFIAKATAGVTLNGITVRNCKTSSGNGGAINMIPTPETTLPPPPPTLLKCNRCRFINCRADAGNGGAIYMAYGNLVGCEFLGNTAKEGGAVGVDGTTNPPTALGSTAGFPSPYALFVQGNTFAWNDASVLGGAISCNAQSFTQISSNSFYRNSSPAGGH